jgi:hypothetical protein
MPTEQMNFRCSRGMARVLLEGSQNYGGIRQFVAHLLRETKHEVPDWDLEVPSKIRQL